MVNKNRAIDSFEETLQWVVSGAVAGMTITVSQETNNFLTVLVVLTVAVALATPTNHMIKWVADQGRN